MWYIWYIFSMLESPCFDGEESPSTVSLRSDGRCAPAGDHLHTSAVCISKGCFLLKNDHKISDLLGSVVSMDE